MRLENDRVILRDMIPADVEDRVYWQTVETEWMDWDAPWENDPRSIYYEPFDELAYRRYCVQRLANPMDENQMRMSFQICSNDGQETHIGWCNCYLVDEEYRFSPVGTRHTIGIDIPPPSARRKGYATAAWMLFIQYLLTSGVKYVYTQTWSGNERVLGLIHKLGFREVDRKKGIRFVNGKPYDALTFRLSRHAFLRMAKTTKQE
jgi:RimJ/RimL family protein N-acetyltransferase